MKLKLKYFFLGFSSSIFFLLLIFFLFGPTRLKNYYVKSYNFLRKSLINKSNFKNKDFSNCLPESIRYIPKESSIIIGHAYGRGKSRLIRETFNPKLEKFLIHNKNNINTLFLTGDVFNVPSLAKWEHLYQKFENYFDIYIAPGDHDVNFPYRVLFTLYIGKKQPIEFPFFLKRAGFNIIVDDSNLKKTILDDKSNFEKINNLDSDIIFLRHHVLINKLAPYSGSSISLKRKDDFEKKLASNFKINFIYGNGGMYKNKPRIACYKHSNINHILNGIGDFDDDYILLLNNKKIFKYQIPN